jgi:2'-5' RNA ligase
LIAVHRRIWENMRDIASDPHPLYLPDVFVPHITLAAGDLTPEIAGLVLEELAFISFSWDLPVDHLALITQSDETSSEVKFRFTFQASAL